MKRALLLVCILAAPAYADSNEKSRLELQAPAKGYKALAVENQLGDVRIEGHDGNGIVIETHKHAPDDEGLDRLRISLVPDPDGTVRISTHADPSPESKSVPRSAVSIDIVIKAPRKARLDVAVGSGKLEVVNMDAGGELDSASGAISVKNVGGELYSHTVSCHLSIAQAFGSVDAATLSSDMELDGIAGQKLFASANQGTIAGRRVRSRDIELTTTTGRIMLEAEAGLRSHIVVSSLRGDIDVKVRRQPQSALIVRGRGTKVDLGASTVGQVGNWQEVKFGTGGEAGLVELRASVGSVRFAVIQ